MKAAENKAESGAAAEKRSADYYNELVQVRLFRDDNRYKDDVFVAVNGSTMMIKRGVDVMIPRKFALVLENSEKQDSKARETVRMYSENEQVIRMV